jgi:hypothetical protein
MAKGEIHIELSVNFADDPKVRALARYGKDARGLRDLWVQMLCHAKETLTDGYVSSEQLGILVYPDPPKVGVRDAQRLVAVGLLEVVDGGFFIPTFLKRNKSRGQVHARIQQKHDDGVLANHRRWHVNKGKTDPLCDHCMVDPPIGTPIDQPIGTPIGTRHQTESTETETETETETVDKELTPSSRKRSESTGTRVPDPFPIDEALKAWFAEHCPDLDGPAHHVVFMDYWRGVAGAKGRKQDWPATWRNWMRRAAADQHNRARPLAAVNGTKPSTTDQRVAAGLALVHKFAAEEAL